jgi:hypothetical protein
MPAASSLASPKSRIFALTACRHKDIRRLDIAMNDAFGMRRIQSVRDLHSVFEQPV